MYDINGSSGWEPIPLATPPVIVDFSGLRQSSSLIPRIFYRFSHLGHFIVVGYLFLDFLCSFLVTCLVLPQHPAVTLHGDTGRVLVSPGQEVVSPQIMLECRF